MVSDIVGCEQTMPGNLGGVQKDVIDDYTFVGNNIRGSDSGKV